MKNKHLEVAVSILLGMTSFAMVFAFDGHADIQLQKGEKAPNVIVIFPDQLRNSSLGIWSKPGYDKHLQVAPDPVVTPNLDKLAEGGILFNRAISNFPLCSPYRAMLISGAYPTANGVEGNCKKGRKFSLKSNLKCMTDVFSENGYDVSYFGKLHWLKTEPLFDKSGKYFGTTEPPGGHYVNAYDTYVPPGKDRHSIDYFYQVLNDHHFKPRVYSNDPKVVAGNEDGTPHRPGRFNAEVESEAVIKYLEVTHAQRDPDKPFFMMWSLNPPHNPWTASTTKMEYFDQYTEDGQVKLDSLLTHENADHESGAHAPYYFANVSAVDHYIGLVVDKLEELGIEENTIILLSSDHGEMLGSHGKQGKNVPQVESLNIPFVLKWGDKLKHRVEDRIVSAPDVMPTILGLAGLSEAIPSTVQGEDFSSLITEPSKESDEPTEALILGYSYRGLYTGDYTFVVESKKNKPLKVYYHDNVSDPYQLVKHDPKKLGKDLESSMKTKLVDLLKSTGDQWALKKIADSYLDYSIN